MKSYAPLALLVLLLMSASANSNWSDRLKSWLPEFITSWWWPEDEDLATIPIQSPEAMDWLTAPEPGRTSFQFNWPQISLTPYIDLVEEEQAALESVLLRNISELLPLSRGVGVRLVYAKAEEAPTDFLKMLQVHSSVVTVPYEPGFFPAQLTPVPTIIFVEDQSSNWWNDLVSLPFDLPVIFVFLGAEDALPKLPSHWSVVFNPTRGSASELYLGQAIFGGQKLQGHLHRPSAEFPLGSGITMEATNLAYSVPEAEDLDREKLEKIDDHIRRAIRRRATPGAQLLVAKNGKIVYQKSYGHHTYKRKSLVQTSNQYDLASVTKAAATSLAIMKLYENGQIDLAAQVRDYLPQFSNRPVGRYTIEQVLTHQTGVQSDLPIGKLLNRKYVSEEESDDFPYQIGPDRWLDKDVPAKVYEELKRVNYTKRRVYRYSDVNYVLLQMVVEAIIEQDMNKFLRAEIYDPLGLQRLGFLPLEQFPEEQMIPTVEDEWMRSSLLRGFPQDEGASLLGGVAGHAGLFGNVTDLAALFQMLLNEGELNGVQIFTPETVQLFTAHSEMNYRALGFDRLAGGWPNVIKNGASKATFGHTGYSGTCVWADPDNDLIFVLLTNRIHPNPYNKRFLKMAVRGRVHRDIYRSIEGA